MGSGLGEPQKVVQRKISQGAVATWRPEETGGGSAYLNVKADSPLEEVA